MLKSARPADADRAPPSQLNRLLLIRQARRDYKGLSQVWYEGAAQGRPDHSKGPGSIHGLWQVDRNRLTRDQAQYI